MRRIRNTASATLAANATSANKNDPITNASVPIFLLGYGMSGIGIFVKTTGRLGRCRPRPRRTTNGPQEFSSIHLPLQRGSLLVQFLTVSRRNRQVRALWRAGKRLAVFLHCEMTISTSRPFAAACIGVAASFVLARKRIL